MRRISILLLLYSGIFITPGFTESLSGLSSSPDSTLVKEDSLFLKQALYNGRVWRNLYSSRVTGSQFLFTRDFLPGSLKMNGRLFSDLQLRYDIYEDEVLIITDKSAIIQLNKEMVDMFTLNYDNLQHTFIRLDADSLNPEKGYFDVLYKGNTSLLVKNISEISRLAQGRTYDVFINSQRIYISKEGKLYLIKRNEDFYDLLTDSRQEIKNYMKINRVKISRKTPESFVRVLKFYDSIPH